MNLLNRAACIVVIVTLTVPALAWSQASPRQEKGIEGTLLNQDYFTAALYPEVQSLLNNVTHNHFDERVFRNFREADINWAQGDCEYVLTRFPNHPGALHLYAEIAKKTGKPSIAILAFEKALREYPEYAFTHAQYGHFLVEQGAVIPGILELQEALRLDPDLITAKAWLENAQRLSDVQPAASTKRRPGS